MMAGKLYLCATPIGNLEDITYRPLRTLKEVDLIAKERYEKFHQTAESFFEIKTPMTSYHEFNKIDKAYQLVDKLREGKKILHLSRTQERRVFLIRGRSRAYLL